MAGMWGPGRVLVGVDGSEGSRIALRWAAEVAATLDAPLHVLAAWQYPSEAVVSVGQLELAAPDRAHEAVEANLAEVVGEVLGGTPSKAILEVVRGPAADALLRAAAKGTRMLVVGSRGLGGFRGLLVGSVSRQVADHAPCPVTVVGRTNAAMVGRLHTVVVAVDGSDTSLEALRFAGDLATRAGAELAVVNATGPDDEPGSAAVEHLVDLDTRRAWVEEWCQPLRDMRVDHHIAVLRGDPRHAVLDAAHDRHAQLIVVGSRGHGPLARLVLGSVADALVQHSDIPVTVVPPSAGRH